MVTLFADHAARDHWALRHHAPPPENWASAAAVAPAGPGGACLALLAGLRAKWLEYPDSAYHLSTG